MKTLKIFYILFVNSTPPEFSPGEQNVKKIFYKYDIKESHERQKCAIHSYQFPLYLPAQKYFFCFAHGIDFVLEWP